MGSDGDPDALFYRSILHSTKSEWTSQKRIYFERALKPNFNVGSTCFDGLLIIRSWLFIFILSNPVHPPPKRNMPDLILWIVWSFGNLFNWIRIRTNNQERIINNPSNKWSQWKEWHKVSYVVGGQICHWVKDADSKFCLGKRCQQQPLANHIM